MNNLIEIGYHKLHSGQESNYKLVADDFIKNNLQGLAFIILEIAGPFSSVEGIPRGGSLLAEYLQKYVVPKTNKTIHLIVDDVLTTGGSFEKAKADWEFRVTGRNDTIPAQSVKGIAVFGRGEPLYWTEIVFQLNKKVWSK